MASHKMKDYGSMSSTPPRTPRNVMVVHPTTRIVIHMSSSLGDSNNNNERSSLMLQNSLQPCDHEVMNWKVFFLLSILIAGLIIGIHLLIEEYNEKPVNHPFVMFESSLWSENAPQADSFQLLDGSQVTNVVFFHTRSKHCWNYYSCVVVIRELEQEYETNIPFNFLIGGDGRMYEIRGWMYASGFDLPRNNETITVGLIGDFTHHESHATAKQLAEAKAFISESIRRKKLNANYRIYGARLHEQDGEKFFKNIESLTSRWAGYV